MKDSILTGRLKMDCEFISLVHKLNSMGKGGNSVDIAHTGA